MEATEIGGCGIVLHLPLGLGLVQDLVQGKQVDLTRPHQAQVLVQALQYQVCVATSFILYLLK